MKNWKTTVAGYGSAVLNLFANGVNWKQILLSTGLAVLGQMAQDQQKKNEPPKPEEKK